METPIEEKEIGANFKGDFKNHPIKTIPLANTFFAERSGVDKDGKKTGVDAGEDYRETFKRTLNAVIAFAKEKGWKNEVFAGLSPEEMEKKANEFLDEFQRIKVDDTLYNEIPESLPRVFQRIDGVSLWSSGHESYQPKKIENSGIKNLLQKEAEAQRQSGRKFFLETAITQNKEAEIPNILERFRSTLKDGEQSQSIRVVVYDDTLSNFQKAEKYIKEFEKSEGIRVERVYVFAKTGRIGEEQATVEKEKKTRTQFPDLKTALSISELANFLPEGKDISTVLLLDFDGALSDTRFMRVRQAHVVYRHVMGTLKSLAQKHAGWDNKDEGKAQIMREQIKEMYSQIDSLWKLTKEQGKANV